MRTFYKTREMIAYLKYLGVVLLLPLMVACSEDEEGGDDGGTVNPEPPTTEICADAIAAQTVTTYQVGGEDQDLQNVKVTFNSDQTFELLLPGVDAFGTKGTWAANDDCSEITLTDDDSNTLPVTVKSTANGQVTLTFKVNNFKEDPVEFEIVLVPPSS